MTVMSASPSFAASVLASLDPDHDGTVDHKELHGRISCKDWAIADPDNDKTVSKDEYLAYVEVLFKRADPDNDGTIDAKELKSPAGHALLRLLK
jgi:Ca2+-binding EF-hand superfamily protein